MFGSWNKKSGDRVIDASCFLLDLSMKGTDTLVDKVEKAKIGEKTDNFFDKILGVKK